MRIGIEAFRPEKLTLAREFRIRTKKSLAECIGTSSSNLTKWEAGEHKPEEKHLFDLAWALDFPVSWFLLNNNAGSTGQRHRSLKSTLKRQKSRMTAALSMMDSVASILSEYVDFPTIDLPGGSWKSSGEISDADVLSMALETRRHFGFGLGPAGDIVDGMESNGVLVARCEVGGTKIDGVSAWANTCERPLVLLATDKANAARSRFDAAHELGHLVLHRNLPELDFDNAEEMEAEFALQERQADLFASEFLLPAEAFISEVRLAHLDEFANLKLKWRASVKMMITKASKLKLIDKEYAKELYIFYNARGWNRGEPHDEFMKFEQPEAIRSALEYLVEDDASFVHQVERRSGLNQPLLSELFQFSPDIKPITNVVPLRKRST